MRLIILIFSFLLLLSVILAQEENTGNSDKIIIHADVLEGTQTAEGSMREYRGNVKLWHNDIYATSDTAYLFYQQNKAELKGNVVIKQKNMLLKSHQVEYFGNTGIAKSDEKIEIQDSAIYLKADKGKYNTKTYIVNFNGNVFIKDDKEIIKSDFATYNRKTFQSYTKGNVIMENDSVKMYSNELYYNRKTRDSKNYGNVVVIGKFNHIYLTGDTIINKPDKNYTIATGNPVLFKIDSTKKDSSQTLKYDTLTVACDTMEAFRDVDKERYDFTGNVEMIRGNIRAMSDLATFFKSDGIFFLRGNPVVWYDSTQLHADSIIIYMPDNQLKMIHSFGNAIAVTNDDTIRGIRKNQLIGKSIKIFIDSNNIDRIESYGDAKSLYFMYSNEGYSGVSRNSSDTIKIFFKDNKPTDVYWLGAPDGKYLPETIIYNKVKDYFLPNYRWTDKIPKKTELVLPKN